MSNAIDVFNAGSSNLKFSLFLDRGAILKAGSRGQIEVNG
jgi:acetate kinase